MPKGRRANNEGTINQRADGRWEARITLPNGKRKSLYAKTEKEVRAKMKAALSDVDAGRIVADDKITVKQFFSQWVETHALQVSNNRIRLLDVAIRLHILPRFGHLVLTRITPQILQRIFNQMVEDGISSKVIQSTKAVLNQGLNYAVDMEILERNPARKIIVPKSERRVYTVWTEDQVRTFLEGVKGDVNEPFWYLLATSGMRIGEVVPLRWRHIDFTQGTVRVEATITLNRIGKEVIGSKAKTRSSVRTIYLPQQTMSVLRDRYNQLGGDKVVKPDDFISPSPTGHMHHTWTLRYLFRRIIKRLSLLDIRPHDLRHTTATILFRRKVNIKVISHMLGHANVTMTLNVYAHLFDEMEREGVEALDAMFDR